YVPLQVKEGDEALYLHAGGYELEINNERYIVVNQGAILLVLRNEIPDSVDSL
ncbi:co-chaperone GroES, partial [Candidatus Saccharibacteria bacterium]|nr:co-chaperone GroES [Candidatus Saccharibacteria bacterium]